MGGLATRLTLRVREWLTSAASPSDDPEMQSQDLGYELDLPPPEFSMPDSGKARGNGNSVSNNSEEGQSEGRSGTSELVERLQEERGAAPPDSLRGSSIKGPDTPHVDVYKEHPSSIKITSGRHLSRLFKNSRKHAGPLSAPPNKGMHAPGPRLIEVGQGERLLVLPSTSVSTVQLADALAAIAEKATKSDDPELRDFRRDRA
ncbi:hypothetical protein GCM10027070_25330 [Barrientosiimonas humi]